MQNIKRYFFILISLIMQKKDRKFQFIVWAPSQATVACEKKNLNGM